MGKRRVHGRVRGHLLGEGEDKENLGGRGDL